MLNRIRNRFRNSGNGPWLFASVVVVAIAVSGSAFAFGEGRPILGGKRNPSTNASRAFTSETQIIANNSTYGTRQSNKSDNGGGAIYGCRSGAGGTPKGNEPCIRANNLAQGLAFEYESNGPLVGTINSSNANAAPFTTNAHGVATGLNADQVDGKSASDLQAQFAAVSATGTLGNARGATAAARTTGGGPAGDYTVTFASDVSKCAYSATVIGNVAAEFGTANVAAVDATHLRVHTFDQAAPPAAADRAFHLVVNC